MAVKGLRDCSGIKVLRDLVKGLLLFKVGVPSYLKAKFDEDCQSKVTGENSAIIAFLEKM